MSRTGIRRRARSKTTARPMRPAPPSTATGRSGLEARMTGRDPTGRPRARQMGSALARPVQHSRRVCLPRRMTRRRPGPRQESHMRRVALRTAAATAALVLAAMTLPARAQNVYAYLYDPARVRTDDQLFLNLAVRDLGLAPSVLDPLLPRVRSLQSDLPVIFFLSRQTGRPVAEIVDLRARGLSWAQVFRRLGLGYDTLFTGIDRDPGPYYRSTWTYWT